MTIYIVDIEAVDTRYTKQWKEHLPKQLKKSTNVEVVTISGGDTPQATTPGASLILVVLMFIKVNNWNKSEKCFVMAKLKMATIFCTLMLGILQLFNYVIWQNY